MFKGSTENVNRTVSGWPVPPTPLTTFCNDGETSISCGQTYPDSHLACHCDPRCVFYNDCCIDYALSCTSNGTLDYPAPEAIVGINHGQVTCIRAPGSPSCGYYQFVSSCPSSWTRDDVRFECERDADLQSPHQFIPVDFMREITFKNVYCAICNGKDTLNLIPWVLEAECCSMPFSLTFEKKVVFIIEQCEKWFMKAPELESSIERSCPVIPIADRCNSTTTISCDGRGDSVIDVISISLLLDFREFRSPVSCRIDQRFDSETLTCVNLTCPKGFILAEQHSCIRADPRHITNKDCRGATNLPTNISIKCIDRLSKLNDQCLPSFLLADEVHSALDEILNLTQEITVDRIQVMTPYYVNGNETKCTRRVNISGYLEGNFFAKLDLFFSSSKPSGISLSSFYCQISRFQVTYGCLSEMDYCPNQATVSNPKPYFDNMTSGINFENPDFSLYNSTYYITHTLDMSTESYTKDEYIYVCNFTNFESCPLLTLNASLFKEMHDGSLLYIIENISFPSGEFTKIGNHSVQICNFIETESQKFLNYSQTQAFLSATGSCLSIISLLLTIATYGWFKNMRKTTFSVLIMSLSVSLVLAHTLLLVSGVSETIPGACIAVAIIGHYMWLVVFSHTSALAVDLHRRFGVTVNVRQTKFNEGAVILSYFLVFAWMCPLLIMIPCMCLFFTGFNAPNFNLSYGQGGCWIGHGLANLYMFGIPIAFFLLINLIIFASIIAGIRTKTAPKAKEQTNTYSKQLSNLWINVKVIIDHNFLIDTPLKSMEAQEDTCLYSPY